MNNFITRYLVVDEHGMIFGDFSCEGLAYELMDSLISDYPCKEFSIKQKVVEDV